MLSFVSAPNFEAPTDTGANNVYDVTVQVADGNGGSATQALAVTVTNTNEAPVITSSASVSVAENATSVTTVTASDVDAGQTLSYSIAGGADAGRFTINASTGALSFVTAPNFEAPADTGANNVDDVTVQVADGNGGSATQALAVTVTNTNEAPVITSSASVSVAENATSFTTVTATDADAGQTLTYAIAGGADAARFTINASTGALSFVTAPNFEAPTDTGVNNVYDVTVQVSDGIGGSTQALAVTVTNSNEAPAITSNGGGSTASVSVAENTASVTTVTASDVDTGQMLTYSIAGGVDAAMFTINASTGALSFVTAPNYEAGPTSFEVAVTASDGTLSTTPDHHRQPDRQQRQRPDDHLVGDLYGRREQTAVGTVVGTDADARRSTTRSPLRSPAVPMRRCSPSMPIPVRCRSWRAEL